MKTILGVIFVVIVLLMVMVIVTVAIPNASGSQIAVLNLTKSHILAVNGTIVQNASISVPYAYDNSKDSIKLDEHPNCNPDITNLPCYDVEDTRQEAGYSSMEGPYTEDCDGVPCTEKEKQEFEDAGEKWPEQIYDEEHGTLYDQ